MKYNRVKIFTLIELLFVIAIIAILFSILLPSLTNARHVAKKMSCSSNMQNIYKACMMYVNDWNGWMPPTDDSTSRHIYSIAEYLNLKPSAVWTLTGGNSCVFEKPSGIAFCPSVTADPQGGVPSHWAGGSATATYYCSNYQPTQSQNDATSGVWLLYYDSTLYKNRRFESINARSVILVDMNWAWTVSTAYRCGTAYGGNYTASLTHTNAPGWNHLNSANFLFKDGHIQAYHWTGVPLFDNNYIPNK